MQKAANTRISNKTMVAPTGVERRIESSIPKKVASTEITAANITVDLKLLQTLIAQSAGKTMSAEVKSEPARFIASTIITAVAIAITVL